VKIIPEKVKARKVALRELGYRSYKDILSITGLTSPCAVSYRLDRYIAGRITAEEVVLPKGDMPRRFDAAGKFEQLWGFTLNDFATEIGLTPEGAYHRIQRLLCCEVTWEWATKKGKHKPGGLRRYGKNVANLEGGGGNAEWDSLGDTIRK